MPTRIIPILDRLRQDLARVLSPESIRSACRQAGYRWRNRELDPVATVMLFLLQVLNGNTACQHVVHFGRWAFTASAYCKARRRLPLRVLQILVEQVAEKLRSATSTSATWLGRRVWIIDGSSFSMADLPELQNHFGQPAGQRPGCGFPVAHWVALFDLATGMLLRVAAGPMRSHDMSKTPEAEADVAAGDVVLGDRGFCSYAHIATLLGRGVDAVFRLHQKRIVAFADAKPGARPPVGLGVPRSLRVRSNGVLDQEVVWSKPERKPAWMGAGEFAALPARITARELRYQVNTPGFRVREITLVTTPLDPQAYPKAELAELYRRRWQVELNFRHMKISMKMDVLRCRTVDGVMKELAMFTLAYNLIASVRMESAARRSVAVDRVGFVDAIRWLTSPRPGGDAGQILINPSRPNRVEPRVRKRRPKQFPLMKEPRKVLRNRLMGKADAA